MSVDKRRIVVIGTGKIGEALIKGLCASGWRKPSEIIATDIHSERLQAIKERCGVETSESNREAVKDAGLIVVAVKPQDLPALLDEIGDVLTSEQTVLSVAAAVRTPNIEKHLSANVPVVRAMPNTPATVQEGMAGICAGAHAGEEHLALAEEVLAHIGAVWSGRASARGRDGRRNSGLRFRPGLLRASRRSDDRGRYPARSLA